MWAMAGPHSSARTHALLHAEDVDDAARRVEEMLRERGIRVTRPRRAVVQALAGRHTPVTAEQVVALVETEGAHRASVYRSLEVLVESGVLERSLRPGGGPVYHLAAVTVGREHVHLVCSTCGQVDALPVDVLDAMAASVGRRAGFAVDTTGVTLTGRCAGCTGAV
jgi:Fur family ferric uptake transcriptional regulator